MKDILSAIVERRTNYNISKESPMPDEELIHIVREVVKHTPSPQNMQSQRAILLLGEHHDKLWGDIVMNTLRERVPEDQFAPTEDKVNGFLKGYGTVLYYEDEVTVSRYAEESPKFAENFNKWGEHSNAMMQINIWNLLAARGFAVNIQHYNPIIDDLVTEEWDIPEAWHLIAQMPFGVPTGDPWSVKEFIDIDEKMRVVK